MIQWLLYHPITTLAFAIFAFALWRGGPAERLGAGLMISEWFLELAVDGLKTNHIAVVPTVFCDFLLACGLLVIAIRFGKLWLGAAMVLQGLGLAMHALTLGADAPGYEAYVALLNAVTLLLLLCLLSGALAHWRRSRRRRRRDVAGGAAALAV